VPRTIPLEVLTGPELIARWGISRPTLLYWLATSRCPQPVRRIGNVRCWAVADVLKFECDLARWLKAAAK
jgi:hypothetical protein